MRFKLIACKVFYREVSLLTAESPHTVDVTWIRQGYHDTPDLLRQILQEEIDRIDSGEDRYTTRIDEEIDDFDAIILLYGLCCNGVTGLTSRRYSLVIPRAHDCIAVLLGSRETYNTHVGENSGIYWYSPGWIDYTAMPGPKRFERKHHRYTVQYGEENADYLLETEEGWVKDYSRCCYINWPQMDGARHKKFSRECA